MRPFFHQAPSEHALIEFRGTVASPQGEVVHASCCVLGFVSHIQTLRMFDKHSQQSIKFCRACGAPAHLRQCAAHIVHKCGARVGSYEHVRRTCALLRPRAPHMS